MVRNEDKSITGAGNNRGRALADRNRRPRQCGERTGGKDPSARIERAASLFVAGKPNLVRGGIRFDIVTVAPYPRHIKDAWRP